MMLEVADALLGGDDALLDEEHRAAAGDLVQGFEELGGCENGDVLTAFPRLYQEGV